MAAVTKPFEVRDALFLFTIATLLLLLLPGFVQPGLPGLVAAQIVIALPVVLLALSRGPGVAARLGLFRPPVRALLAAALIGTTFWLLLVILIAPLIEPLARKEETEHLTELVSGPAPLWLRLAAVALLPALCEELLFRGAILGALRAAYGPWLAGIGSSLAFAAFHFSLLRFLPTALLGALLAGVFLRSRSLWPCVLLHFLNNAAAIVVTSLDRPSRAVIGTALGVALAANVAGFALLWPQRVKR